MIIGIGTDIVDISRIAKLLNAGKHFAEKVFSQREIAYASSKASPAQSFAARFAAKEAFMKAIGTGWDQGVSWKNIEVLNNSSGKPELVISGQSLALLKALKIDKMHLSLSHERDYAIAYVVLEALPDNAV